MSIPRPEFLSISTLLLRIPSSGGNNSLLLGIKALVLIVIVGSSDCICCRLPTKSDLEIPQRNSIVPLFNDRVNISLLLANSFNDILHNPKALSCLLFQLGTTKRSFGHRIRIVFFVGTQRPWFDLDGIDALDSINVCDWNIYAREDTLCVIDAVILRGKLSSAGENGTDEIISVIEDIYKFYQQEMDVLMVESGMAEAVKRPLSLGGNIKLCFKGNGREAVDPIRTLRHLWAPSLNARTIFPNGKWCPPLTHEFDSAHIQSWSSYKIAISKLHDQIAVKPRSFG